ncbi:MAG: HAD hydrolase family protein, partial [Phaeodactylibacter sp.]|nr:HAD hydrolase family protein [Phaeodactylibacter sp.]
GIEDIFVGISDKLSVFRAFVEQEELDPEEILYMGDDLPDFEVMRRVGLPACPQDAAQEIIALSHYVSPKAGGRGCVRDVVEKVMRVHRKWPYQQPTKKN